MRLMMNAKGTPESRICTPVAKSTGGVSQQPHVQVNQAHIQWGASTNHRLHAAIMLALHAPQSTTSMPRTYSMHNNQSAHSSQGTLTEGRKRATWSTTCGTWMTSMAANTNCTGRMATGVMVEQVGARDRFRKLFDHPGTSSYNGAGADARCMEKGRGELLRTFPLIPCLQFPAALMPHVCHAWHWVTQGVRRPRQISLPTPPQLMQGDCANTRLQPCTKDQHGMHT